jgi:hypothetical protein
MKGRLHIVCVNLGMSGRGNPDYGRGLALFLAAEESNSNRVKMPAVCCPLLGCFLSGSVIRKLQDGVERTTRR